MHYFRTLRDMYNAPQMQEMAHLPRMQELQERLQKMTYAQVLDTVAIFGDPAYCIERLQWFKETFGMSQFICWFNTGGKIPHKQVMESMRLFAERSCRTLIEALSHRQHAPNASRTTLSSITTRRFLSSVVSNWVVACKRAATMVVSSFCAAASSPAVAVRRASVLRVTEKVEEVLRQHRMFDATLIQHR